MHPRLVHAWQVGQRGWPPAYPVAQLPNAPLIVALGAMLGERLTDGGTSTVFDVTGRVALTAWAGDELLRGSNAFRRVLGAVALGFVVAGVIRDV